MKVLLKFSMVKIKRNAMHNVMFLHEMGTTSFVYANKMSCCNMTEQSCVGVIS